jgi:long-chain fatty acid transport protein
LVISQILLAMPFASGEDSHVPLTSSQPSVRLAVLSGILLTGSGVEANALGIRIADQDSAATARGNAFAATADNPSAIFYNPAGLTQLEGHHVRLGSYAIALDSQFTSPGGVRFDTKSRVDAVPQLYYSYGMKDLPLAFGLGLYAPYGLALEWPNNAEFGAVYGKMTYLRLSPVVAWQVHPTLSLAAGIGLDYGKTEIRQQAITGAPGSMTRFTGDDTDAGFTLGLLWQPMKRHSFGVTYRSPTTMAFKGTGTTTGTGFIDGTGAASAHFPFPRQVVVGYSFRPTQDWNLEFNADWTDWSSLKMVGFQLPAGTVPVPFNWRASWFYEFGVTRQFEGGWRASAGYIFSENSVPTANFSPLVPDSDRHVFSFGFGRQKTRLTWDVAYQLGWGPSRNVSGSSPPAVPIFVGPPAASANGNYTFLSHAITASVGFRF